jgi:hypothetical protein
MPEGVGYPGQPTNVKPPRSVIDVLINAAVDQTELKSFQQELIEIFGGQGGQPQPQQQPVGGQVPLPQGGGQVPLPQGGGGAGGIDPQLLAMLSGGGGNAPV